MRLAKIQYVEMDRNVLKCRVETLLQIGVWFIAEIPLGEEL